MVGHGVERRAHAANVSWARRLVLVAGIVARDLLEACCLRSGETKIFENAGQGLEDTAKQTCVVQVSAMSCPSQDHSVLRRKPTATEVELPRLNLALVELLLRSMFVSLGLLGRSELHLGMDCGLALGASGEIFCCIFLGQLTTLKELAKRTARGSCDSVAGESGKEKCELHGERERSQRLKS